MSTSSNLYRSEIMSVHRSANRGKLGGFWNKKFKLMTGITAGSAVLLSACGGTSVSSQPVSGTVAKPVDVVLWESHNGGPVGGAMSKLVDEFNVTHPTIHMSIDVTKASSKLLAAIAAGNPPVLAEISHYDGKYVKANTLVSWNSFMSGSSVVSQSNLYPAIWKNGEVGGQHYRLEADAKISEVFYNETLFNQAGITSAPTTWTQMATDAAKLKTLGVIPIGWKDSSAHILPAFMSNGGTLLSGSNSVGHSVDFNNQAGQQTFSYFANLYSNGDLTIDHGTTLRADLASSHMAMIDGTSAGYAKVLDAVGGKFKVGAFVEPGGSTGHAANLVQGLGFVLPKGHTHVQDEAAWTFVQWWFEPAQQVQWDELTGYAPETKAATAALNSGSFLPTHPGLAASIGAIESSFTVPRPVSDSYNEVQASLDAAFINATTGKASVSSSLGTLESQGNSYMSGASEL